MTADERKISGSLGALSLMGMLQLLAAESRTGRLDVAGADRAGSLWLEKGLLVHACASGASQLVGEPALDALVGLSDGTFDFATGELTELRSLEGPTEQLLMEAAIRRDHARAGDPAQVVSSSVPAFAPLPRGGATPRFTTLQWRVLAAIDGRKAVDAIAAEVQLPVEALASIIAELEIAGVIQVT